MGKVEGREQGSEGHERVCSRVYRYSFPWPKCEDRQYEGDEISLSWRVSSRCGPEVEYREGVEACVEGAARWG